MSFAGEDLVMSGFSDDSHAHGFTGARQLPSGTGPVLIEREGALANLGRLFTDSAKGKGRLAVVQGPMGSGKTKLMHGFLEAVEDSPALVLSATASRRESVLPFGVLSQLFQKPQVPYLVRAGVREMIEAMTAREEAAETQSNVARIKTLAELHEIFLILLSLAEVRPIVIGVDDLQYVDSPSLRCLSYIVPRLRAARILTILTDGSGTLSSDTAMRSELLQQPNVHHVNLGLLTREGVGRLVSGQLGSDAARRLTADFFELSGGNPLVLQNLVHDQQLDMRHLQGYSRALLSCLHRCEPVTLAVVRALAVLGPGASPADVGRLAEAGKGETDQVLRSLDSAGFLNGNAFRHPSAAVDVLDDMSAQERFELRRRAAELLYDGGGPAVAVAEQLINADSADAPWAAGVLLDAAQDLLAASGAEMAVDCLKLAQRATRNGPSRAAIRSRLSRIEWQLDPLSSPRYLSPLVAEASAGYLAPRDLIDLVWQLSWQGDINSMTDVLDEMPGVPDIQGLLTWLSCQYPLYPHARKPAVPAMQSLVPSAKANSGIPRVDPWLAAAAMADGLVRGQADSIIAKAEQALQTLRLDHDSLWSGETALLALLSLAYADKFEAATTWCDRLLTEACSRNTPTLRAVFTAVGAEIALRQGDLRIAASQAQASLALVPHRGWGVALGLPLGCLILANVRMGQLDLAAEYVAQPFPEVMRQSRYGLHYLYARGHYRLATANARSALADFLSCGELMEGWSAHGIGPVPWRTSAAEAWLQLGNQDQAKFFVRDQLARTPRGSSRARGLSLRLLAATSSAAQRPQLLAEAVDVLKESGDKYELARALADLSQAFQKVGDQRNARRLARRTWRVAQASGAQRLCQEVEPRYGEEYAASPAGRDLKAHPALSGQERRVAALAAEGYTNQEISNQLFITASTVEQHLTRIFRKLNVKRRQELMMFPG